MTGARLVLRAPAKVNLTLRCLGLRDDGYHDVETTMLALGLEDELLLAARPGTGQVALAVLGDPDVPSDASNLAARAAAAVLKAGGSALDLDLRLVKRIPCEAGLGGGSSDAAAAVLGAARLAGLPAEELEPALGALASDGPFFLAARATGLARCSGRGERVTPLAPLVRRWAVLVVTPDVRAPTAAVYAAWRPSDARAAEEPSDWSNLDEADLRRALANDLEAAALRAVPGLEAWRALLDGAGLVHARLAGSGSSFFAVYADRAEALQAGRTVEEAAARIGRRPRLVRVVPNSGTGIRPASENPYG